MTNIVVAGEVFSPNLGDRVIFDCISYLLAKQGVHAIPLDLSGRTDSQTMSRPESKVNMIREAVRMPLRYNSKLAQMVTVVKWHGFLRRKRERSWTEIIADCDGVIIGGGQLITDRNFRFPPLINEVARIAESLNKPLAFFACGVGSNWGHRASKIYTNALSYAKYLSVRDEVSATVLRGHVPAKNISVHPDPGFLAGEVYESTPRKAERNIIGFNVLTPQHFRSFVPELKQMSDQQYIEFWIRLAKGATGAGKKVRFVTNGDSGDHSVAEKIVNHLGGNVSLATRPTRATELVSQLSGVSSLVSTRMHAGIISYGLGVTPVPIAWDQKVANVWSVIGRQKIVQSGSVFRLKNPWELLGPLLAAADCAIVELDATRKEIESASIKCLQTLSNS